MPLLKKLDWQWEPSEKRDLQVGEVIEIVDAKSLVDRGTAVYCDAKGNEILHPKMMKYSLPVTLNSRAEIVEFIKHFQSDFKFVPEIDPNAKQPSEEAVQAQVESEEKTDTEIILEAIKAKKEARKVAKEKKV